MLPEQHMRSPEQVLKNIKNIPSDVDVSVPPEGRPHKLHQFMGPDVASDQDLQFTAALLGIREAAKCGAVSIDPTAVQIARELGGLADHWVPVQQTLPVELVNGELKRDVGFTFVGETGNVASIAVPKGARLQGLERIGSKGPTSYKYLRMRKPEAINQGKEYESLLKSSLARVGQECLQAIPGILANIHVQLRNSALPQDHRTQLENQKRDLLYALKDIPSAFSTTIETLPKPGVSL